MGPWAHGPMGHGALRIWPTGHWTPCDHVPWAMGEPMMAGVLGSRGVRRHTLQKLIQVFFFLPGCPQPTLTMIFLVDVGYIYGFDGIALQERRVQDAEDLRFGARPL